jgi:hypothetical protein
MLAPIQRHWYASLMSTTESWNTVWPTHGVITGTPVTGVMNYVPLAKTAYIVPARFEAFFGDPQLAYDVDLEVFMDEVKGPQCVNFNARQRPGGAPVSAVGLRSIPLAPLLQQAARFMAYEVTHDEDGTPQFSSVKLSPSALQEIQVGWRWARAAPRRATFPANTQNLKTVGDLVKRSLAEAKKSKRRPKVYADVTRWLAESGKPVSRTTAQRRIEEAQERGFAPRWTKEEK